MNNLQKRLRDWNESGADRYPSFYQLEIEAADALDAKDAEIERLKDHLAFATQERDAYQQASEVACSERDALRARLAECERDAARYRWLRAPAKSKVSGAETSNLMLHALRGGQFSSSLGVLDFEIDAAKGKLP